MGVASSRRSPSFCAGLLFGMITFGIVAAEMQSPTEAVQAYIRDVFLILQNENYDKERRWDEIGRIINARFDFRSMSQSILATNWRAATTEEKRQFVEFFSRYLEDTYRNKIESYDDQSIVYVTEQIRKDRAMVDTEIIARGKRIPVTYRLKNNDGDWYAYDVVIEGMSLVSNYRDTFNAIIKSEGMEGLLSDLEVRITNYKEKHGGLPSE